MTTAVNLRVCALLIAVDFVAFVKTGTPWDLTGAVWRRALHRDGFGLYFRHFVFSPRMAVEDELGSPSKPVSVPKVPPVEETQSPARGNRIKTTTGSLLLP